MNGEFLELYNALAKYIDDKQKSHISGADQRHKENLNKFDRIFTWLQALPCKERAWIVKAIYGIYGIFGAIVIGIIAHIFIK